MQIRKNQQTKDGRTIGIARIYLASEIIPDN